MDLNLHRPHHVFISHARRNPHLAGRLAKEIKKLPNVKVWIDKEDLDDKNPFEQQIVKALGDTATTIVLWTEIAARRDWVKWESVTSFLVGCEIIFLRYRNSTAIPSCLLGNENVTCFSFNTFSKLIDRAVLKISETVEGRKVHLGLLKLASRKSCELIFDKDAFYTNTVDALDSLSGGVHFISGTPAVILPDEAEGGQRLAYLEKLHSVFGSKGRSEALYLTNQRRVIKRLSQYNKARKWMKYVGENDGLVSSPRFTIASSRSLRWLPSGIFSDTFVCLVLKRPETPWQEETMAVLTLRDKRVIAAVRKRFAAYFNPRNYKDQEYFFRQLRVRVDYVRRITEV